MPSSLESLVLQFDSRKPPPVDQWKPTQISSIDITINRSGEWFYQGSKIERKRMVALFSTILWREADTYFLVTLHEKLQITVEVAPFIAELMDVTGERESQSLHFTDNTGNRFTADADHPLWISYTESGQPQPLVIVRRNLPALMSRSVYYQLAELIVEKDSLSGVWSAGEFFKLD